MPYLICMVHTAVAIRVEMNHGPISFSRADKFYYVVAGLFLMAKNKIRADKSYSLEEGLFLMVQI